jgi:hypothetical protein
MPGSEARQRKPELPATLPASPDIRKPPLPPCQSTSRERSTACSRSATGVYKSFCIYPVVAVLDLRAILSKWQLIDIGTKLVAAFAAGTTRPMRLDLIVAFSLQRTGVTEVKKNSVWRDPGMPPPLPGRQDGQLGPRISIREVTMGKRCRGDCAQFCAHHQTLPSVPECRDAAGKPWWTGICRNS